MHAVTIVLKAVKNESRLKSAKKKTLNSDKEMDSVVETRWKWNMVINLLLYVS